MFVNIDCMNIANITSGILIFTAPFHLHPMNTVNTERGKRLT